MNLQGNGHIKLHEGDLPTEFQASQDRLARATLDKAIREEMDVGDEYLELLKHKERSHAEALEAARKELEESRMRMEEERHPKKPPLRNARFRQFPRQRRAFFAP